jgi:hypothetical protein
MGYEYLRDYRIQTLWLTLLNSQHSLADNEESNKSSVRIIAARPRLDFGSSWIQIQRVVATAAYPYKTCTLNASKKRNFAHKVSIVGSLVKVTSLKYYTVYLLWRLVFKIHVAVKWRETWAPRSYSNWCLKRPPSISSRRQCDARHCFEHASTFWYRSLSQRLQTLPRYLP